MGNAVSADRFCRAVRIAPPRDGDPQSGMGRALSFALLASRVQIVVAESRVGVMSCQSPAGFRVRERKTPSKLSITIIRPPQHGQRCGSPGALEEFGLGC